ncbi:MAG: SMP-30/gluconolactonase/LRE family protein [Flavobacterium sp.]|uniref:SMP-30/gluconolactonase/LRE family protein n=1 Tax=Flavobacterium sp. TaxID=239 RepID=UPI0012290079|nr:SMP-30/gluconolactonase/LRE family protein [Flavobacterium sp.]RZJ65925.1 MAG: SMP-30/gluconolactonase/LRE family protein [Flavobacterium sp.]
MKFFVFLSLAFAVNVAAQPNYLKSGKITAIDPTFSTLVAPDAKIEILASGFTWAEGPVWVKDGDYLLFSDPRQNEIFKWNKKDGLTTWLNKSGYTAAAFYSDEPGSNGLLINKQGELVACEQGNRRISKMKIGEATKTTIAGSFDGKPFNSPNDICQHSSGAYYFTDPPYGFQGMKDDPTERTQMFGVYRIAPDGTVTRIIDNLKRPNGIALSPDEKTLYVSQTDREAVIMSYPVNADGSVGKGKIFFDLRPLYTAADGMKIDKDGNIFTGAGNGVMVISPMGKYLGKIDTGMPTANCAFGADGYLYITAGKQLLRVKTLL